MTWQVAADLAVGTAVPVCGIGLWLTNRISRREALFLAWGVLLGASFEIVLFSLGPDFLSMKMTWPLPASTVWLWHSFWDGGLFLAGYALAALVLRKPRERVARRFDIPEVAVMTVWGAASAFVVEWVGNGVIWQYHPKPWNPVWIEFAGQDYTALIQIVWLVAPAVFHMGCVGISRRTPENGSAAKNQL